MKQNFSIKPLNIEFETADRDRIIYIAGVDTYLGRHFARHWRSRGYAVDGCGNSTEVAPELQIVDYQQTNYMEWHIPHKKYAWLMFCHDPYTGYEQHTECARSLCEYLYNSPIMNAQLRLCYPSSAMVCHNHNGIITEDSEVAPCTLLGLTIATAENWFNVYSCRLKRNLLSYILRSGEIYGNEFGQTPSNGSINKMLLAAADGNTLNIPGLGAKSLTVSHIFDYCESVIELLSSDFPPRKVNIPGEKYKICDIVFAIAEHYKVNADFISAAMTADDGTAFTGNKHLSGKRFRKLVNYAPQFLFKPWLKTQKINELQTIA